MNNLLTLLVALLCAAPPASARVIYVDDDATGANDGSSWADAYNYLQDALADANSLPKPVEVRVAQGTYRPDEGGGNTPGDREATFQLIDDVSLKGGYAGVTQPEPDARDVQLYETILSGDLSGDDVDVDDAADLPDEPTRADNSYHVVTASNTDATAVLDGFTISAGDALPDPAYTMGAGLFNETGSPTIANCRFNKNTASHGGAIFNLDSDPILADCSFGNNCADQGGGISNDNSTATLTYCSFENNYGGSWGGGISNRHSSSTLVNCTFRNNVAHDAGAISNRQHSSLTLTDCVFRGNHASGGGAIQNWADSTAELVNCSFTDNHATRGPGGAIHNRFDSELTLGGCSFTTNSASTRGGAVSSGSATSLTLTDCTLAENSAGEQGGTIHNNGTLIVTDCLFVQNCHTPSQTPRHDDGGGAIYNRSQANVVGCIFEANAASQGGAVFNWWGSKAAMFTDCHFRRNAATGPPEEADKYSGGAIYSATSRLSLFGCSFAANTTTGRGGALWHDEPRATNCLFAGNVASDGGAIYDHHGGSKLTNCTFAQNWAATGTTIACDLFSVGWPREITNSILWDQPDQISSNPDSVISIANSNVRGGWPGEGNINADPCFAALGYWADANDPNVIVEPADPNAVWVDGDYHLMSQAGRWERNSESWVKDDVTSPCIDAGNPMSPIGHEPFPNGGRINMGAYGGASEASKSYFGEPICETITAGDINGDCKVDFQDFEILALHWLEQH
jgi:hypothetical protein